MNEALAGSFLKRRAQEVILAFCGQLKTSSLSLTFATLILFTGTKNAVLTALQYSSGNIATIPISPNAPQFIASAKSIQLHGSGPSKRQQHSHPHQVVVHQEYQELLVPDLGSDKVHRLKRNDNGSWQLIGQVEFEPGGGPRHVAFHGKSSQFFPLSHFTLNGSCFRWISVYHP